MLRLLPLLLTTLLVSPLFTQTDSLGIEDVLDVPVASWSDTLRPQLRNLSSEGRVQWLENLILASKAKFGKVSAQHEKALDLIKGSYMATQRYPQTLGTLNELLEIREQLYGEKSQEYADTYRFFGLFYRDTEDPDLAQYYYQEHEQRIRELFGEESTEYINSLVGMAQYYQLVGELEKLESTMSRAVELYEKVGTPKKGFYANLLQNMGIVYHDLNFLDKAEEYYRRAIDTLKAYEIENYTYHYSSHLLGNIALSRGQIEEAEKWYDEEMRVKEQTMGSENLNVQLSRLSNQVTLFMVQERYAEAEPLMLEEVALTEKYYSTRQHSYYANAIVDAARLYQYLGDTRQATDYYTEALDIYYNTVGRFHHFTNNCHAQLAALRMEQGDIAAAEDLLQRIIDYYNVRVENIYPTLSERERLDFARNLEQDVSLLYTFATTQEASRDFILAAADFNLFTKGLILENTLDAKMSAATGKDEELKALYKEWKKTQKTIADNLIVSTTEVAALQTVTDSLRQRANDLEKQLAQRSFTFAAQQQERISNTDIQQKLDDKTAALDLLSFRHYGDKGMTDSTLYYAILTRSDRKTPKLVQLTNSKELERMLGVSSARYAQYPQIGHALYQKVWQPLEPELEGITTICISPSGLLHQVSFAALSTNLQTGTLLADTYEFAYFGNLKEIVKKEEKQGIDRSIALFGGAQFDLDSTNMIAIARQRANQEQILVPSPFDDETNLLVYADTGTRSFSEDSTRYALEFNYLPGTKQEVGYVGKKFRSANWETDVFTDEEALEDNVKSLSGPGAPGIIHIATHGYFFAEPSEEQTAQMTLRERVATAANPLLRSGLALTGVNHAWLGGRPIEGLDDGILTAYEISLLDFFSTDLVVLSACETGKGDILSGEGVFGLQRAFKSAGVKNLIISLWKVPDAQTTELMQTFYDYYLGGDAIRLAFRKAQEQMRQKYAPYYWAGFILVE